MGVPVYYMDRAGNMSVEHGSHYSNSGFYCQGKGACYSKVLMLQLQCS